MSRASRLLEVGKNAIYPSQVFGGCGYWSTVMPDGGFMSGVAKNRGG